jgi:hypothetical protein
MDARPGRILPTIPKKRVSPPGGLEDQGLGPVGSAGTGDPGLGKEAVTRVKAALMDGRLDPLSETEPQVQRLGRIYGPDRSRAYVGTETWEGALSREGETSHPARD